MGYPKLDCTNSGLYSMMSMVSHEITTRSICLNFTSYLSSTNTMFSCTSETHAYHACSLELRTHEKRKNKGQITSSWTFARVSSEQ